MGSSFLSHRVLSPKALSLARLFLLTPVIIAGLPPVRAMLGWQDSGLADLFEPKLSVIALGLSFCLGLLSQRSLRSAQRRAQEVSLPIHRFTELPLVYVALWASLGQLSTSLLLMKGALDTLTLGLSAAGREPRRGRLKTMLSETTLFAVICLILGVGGRLISEQSVSGLLVIHCVYSVVILASQLGLLQKRFIADALSFSNLLCGVASIYSSSELAFQTSLMYLLLGAAFDGFDGAAARKFGGTRWGVYSDDVADGVNYGVAPGFALYYLFGGLEGLVIGTFYATFTISRLIYFTLNKDAGDPDYFAGIPSPVGGMIVMCSVVLFQEQTTWVGFLVGVASTQMVAFSTNYQHMRSIIRDKRALVGAPLYLGVFMVGAISWGVKGGAAVVLSTAILYGFLPSLLSFKALFQSRPALDEPSSAELGAED